MTLNKPERDKQLVQEKCQQILTELLRDDDNKYCVDCDSKGPRWASWNLGIFLCIRCAGIHRNLGVHISKVKSVNLDSWTPEQVGSIQNMGNSKARAVYEANLPDNFSRPQADIALETFIRAKYEHKKYIAKEWVETPPKPAFDVAAELKKEKEKKKCRKPIIIGSHANEIQSNPIPRPTPSSSTTSTTNVSNANQNNINNKSITTTASPSSNQQSSTNATSSASIDLLGLDLGDNTTNNTTTNNNNNEAFGLFASATPVNSGKSDQIQNQGSTESNKTLADEEKDFFSQKSLEQEEKKFTKESILSLYSQTPALPQQNTILNGFPGAMAQVNVPFSSNPLFGVTSTSTVSSSLSTNPFLTATSTGNSTSVNSNPINNNPIFNEFHQHQLIPGLSSMSLQQSTNQPQFPSMVNAQTSSGAALTGQNWFNPVSVVAPVAGSTMATMANPFMDQTTATSKTTNSLNTINFPILKTNGNGPNDEIKPFDTNNFNMW